MSRKNELVGIQFLRGLCAIGVVVDHASGMAAFPKYFGQEIFFGLLKYGAVGVDVFFVISGFIITLVSFKDENLCATTNLYGFAAKRISRIIPLMWISIISYAFLRKIGSETLVDYKSYFNAFFLIPHGNVEPKQIWTLRHEAIFYIIFAISFLSTSIKYGRSAIMIMWFLSPFVVAIGADLFHFKIINNSVIGIAFNPVNIEFGFGFCLGFLKLKRRNLPSVRTAVHPWIVLSILTTLVFYLGGICREHFDPLFARLIIGALASLLVLAAICVSCPQGRLTTFGDFLGNTSYSIYLFHPHFASAILSVLSKKAHNLNIFIAVFAVSCASILLAIMVSLFVERPTVKLAQRFLLPHRPLVRVDIVNSHPG